jgi:hypothetical protein
MRTPLKLPQRAQICLRHECSTKKPIAVARGVNGNIGLDIELLCFQGAVVVSMIRRTGMRGEAVISTMSSPPTTTNSSARFSSPPAYINRPRFC